MQTNAIELWLIISLLCGLITYLFAKEKNMKSPTLWFVGGFIGSLLTLIIIFTIKKRVGKKTSQSGSG